MLGKLVWLLLQNVGKLWVEVIKHKDLSSTPFMQANKNSVSFIWNSIYKEKTVLQEGYVFQLGDENTPLWHTDWIGLGNLNRYVIFIDIHDLHLCLKGIIVDGEKKINLLYSQLQSHVIEHINTVPSCTNAMVQDFITWSGHSNGIYTANQSFSQNLIWMSPTLEKIKFFLWSTCQNFLPTLRILYRYGMSQSQSCPRYNNSIKHISHCLEDYPLSTQLGSILGFRTMNFLSGQREQMFSLYLSSGFGELEISLSLLQRIFPSLLSSRDAKLCCPY